MVRAAVVIFLALMVSSCAWFTGSKPEEEVSETPEVKPALTSAEVREAAENHVSEGVVDFQNEKYDDAVSAWQQALELIPGDAEVQNFLGIAYHKLGKYEDAKRHFLMATQLDSNYYEAYNNLGYMLLLQENYTAARDAFEHALAINPNYSQAQINIDKTKKIMSGELLREVFELTQRAEKMDDLDQKISFYKKILDLDSTYAEGHNNLGVAYYYADNLDSAYFHLNRAIELNKKYPEAINNLGYIYMLAGRYEDAVKLFLRAVSLKPQYIIALNNLGETYMKMGEKENARRVFQTAFDMDPGNLYARDNLKTLEESTSN
jgi:Flp pilus assembly protein TadD